MRQSREPQTVLDVIATKRDGRELTGVHIDWVVDAALRGVVTTDQLAALAMAMTVHGMNDSEIRLWAAALAASGTTTNVSSVRRPVVAVETTSGVGGTAGLIVLPIVAACGGAALMTGSRWLGRLAGQVDVLESIPGWRGTLTAQRVTSQLDEVGAVVRGVGGPIVPAAELVDRVRDVTGTAVSAGLSAGSLLARALASGASKVVIEVTVGSGGVVPDPASSEGFIGLVQRAATALGLEAVVVATSRQTPLGLAVGPAFCVRQIREVLTGGGPPDLVEVTLALAREALSAAGLEGVDPADTLADGRALQSWRRMIAAQGGDSDAPLPEARSRRQIPAAGSGVLTRLDGRLIGRAAWQLGVGRGHPHDQLDHGAGILLHAKPGAVVRGGEPLLTLCTGEWERLDAAETALEEAVFIAPEGSRPDLWPLVVGRAG